MQITRTDLTPKTASASSFALIGLLVGAAVGVKFADIDQQVPDWLLHHRALLTHGLVVPFLLGLWGWLTKHQLARGLTIGFCVTNAVHLSFDLFPRAWWGYALIHIFVWPLPPVLSWLWIAVSITLCLYLARFFVRTIWDLTISALGIISGFVAYAHEGFFFPLIAFLIAGTLAFLIPFPSRMRLNDGK